MTTARRTAKRIRRVRRPLMLLAALGSKRINRTPVSRRAVLVGMTSLFIRPAAKRATREAWKTARTALIG